MILVFYYMCVIGIVVSTFYYMCVIGIVVSTFYFFLFLFLFFFSVERQISMLLIDNSESVSVLHPTRQNVFPKPDKPTDSQRPL